MLSILYEDRDVLVVRKPAGVESQEVRSFAPDMVSEIRKYLMAAQDIHKLATNRCTRDPQPRPPYVGVIHRLDKPVSGIMVYAKNQKAAAALSAGLQKGSMKKGYCAVVCGKPVDNQGTYVDYLRQDKKNNRSQIVDKSVEDSRRAELNYRVAETIRRQENGEEREYSLVEIELLTGRHHQIRVQFAGHGTPLYGDGRYGTGGQPGAASARAAKAPEAGIWAASGQAAGVQAASAGNRAAKAGLALCACRLSFPHPSTGKIMSFEITPQGGAFDWFTVLQP